MSQVIDKQHLSSFQKLLAAINSLSNWPLIFVDKAGLKQEITYHFKIGYKVICRSRSTDINEAVVIATGIEYPPEYLRLKKNDVVFDLGANIGSFIVYINKLNKNVPFTGFAFEPFTENFRLLKKNAAINNLKKFRLEQAAISNHSGEVYIDTDKDFDAINVTSSKTGQQVPSYKLSSYCKKNKIKRINLLKIDVEGSEYDIFSADKDFLTKNVDRIILEYHYLSPSRNKKTLVNLMEKDFNIQDVSIAGKSGVMYLARKRAKTV